MKKYQTVLLFTFLFVFFFLWNLIVVGFYADELWNYGFSYAIYRGLLPYHDFNMIVTPFYPFMMAFFFYLFGFNMIVFHAVNALIVTILSYFVYKLIGNKMWIVLLFLSFPMSIMFPSYNILVLLFFVLLLYLEKEEKSDWLIGLVIGLAILTKQSIGVCLFLPTLYYWKDKKKILKRLGGMMIPLVVFFVYLIGSHSLMSFLDLCVFGLFDFTKNQPSFNIIYILVVLTLFVFAYWIWKNPKNLNVYYALAMISMTIPLFDIFHFQSYWLGMVLVFFLIKERKIPLRLELFFFGSMILLGIFQLQPVFKEGLVYPNSLHHFEYRMIIQNDLVRYKEINQMLDSYSDREIVFLSSISYLFRIERDEDITFVDLLNDGNHGYHGKDKLLKLIKSKKDALFLVDRRELDPKKQTNKEIIQYVLDHGEKIDEVSFYELYEIKEES